MNEYHPNYVSPPGETLFEVMIAENITRQELADRLGKPVEFVDDLIQGLIEISPLLAFELEQVIPCGPSEGFWMRREQQYREFLITLSKSQRQRSP